MNDNLIKSAKTNNNITRHCSCMNTELELTITADNGMSSEYLRQLGSKKTWVSSRMRVFATESDMLAFAAYWNQETGSVSTARPATAAQIQYLNILGVKIENNMTVERASQLIDWAKRGEDMSAINGERADGNI